MFLKNLESVRMTETGTSSSVEAYNARWLTPPQVASTFVAPFQFSTLAKHRHSMLIGPRGSGKTTLLKMLQPAALERWGGDEALILCADIDYTGVFIPADISWRRQLDAASSCGLDGGSRSIFSDAAFATHILHALVETMCFRASRPSGDIRRPFRRCSLDRGTEDSIVEGIADVLKVQPKISSLLSVKHALSARLAHIHLISSQIEQAGPEDACDLLGRNDFLYLEPLAAANAAVEVFDDYCGEQDAKWALLFDELEIAPESIQKRLMEANRSTFPRFFFKLALSPFCAHATALTSPAAPTPSNDFDQIQLWYAHKEQRGASERKNKFCISLWSSLSAGLRYDEVLDDPIEQPKKRSSSPYAPSGKWGQRFIRLYENDPTFKVFLDGRGINPRNLQALSPAIRASVVRKIAPIVAVRDFYRRPQAPGDSSGAERSRKSVELYTGAEAIFDMSEGHPRWFKVLTSRLLSRASASGDSVRVSASVQSQEIQAAAHRFSALLRTFPVDSVDTANGNRGLLTLVDTIGSFFRDQAVRAPFSPEPNLSFVVDSHVSDGLLDSLAQALNLGAIVYVPDGDGEVLLTSLRGKRFRLSYWLAPEYGLPMILGKPVSLSRVLAQKKGTLSNEAPVTLSLPFGSEGENAER